MHANFFFFSEALMNCLVKQRCIDFSDYTLKCQTLQGYMIFKLDLHYDWLDLHSSPSRNVFCINVNGLKSDFMFSLILSVSGELEGGTARMSPVGSASGSQNLNVSLEPPDPVSRATQQYLEVLKKNYMI